MSTDPLGGRLTVGRYVICDEIAAGGMATVHIGRLMGPVGFARTVAVKRLHPHLAKDPEFVAMFVDEARLAARIRHPNVVPTVDVLVDKGEMLVVMEYVHGEPLSRLIRACRAQTGAGVPVPIALSILSGALYGLHAAHEARDDRGEPLGLVHRDVSPQNILVGVDGVPRVVDFGIAKAAGRIQTTREGSLKGKIPYMSPEQVQSDDLDARTDVYAASVVLWEALTGLRLFSAQNEVHLLTAIMHGRIDPPSAHVPGLPPVLDALVMRGLSRDRGERFASAWEMAEAAQRIAYATPGQVSAWVREMGGAELLQRGARVTQIESSSSLNSVRLSILDAGEATTRLHESTVGPAPVVPPPLAPLPAAAPSAAPALPSAATPAPVAPPARSAAPAPSPQVAPAALPAPRPPAPGPAPAPPPSSPGAPGVLAGAPPPGARLTALMPPVASAAASPASPEALAALVTTAPLVVPQAASPAWGAAPAAPAVVPVPYGQGAVEAGPSQISAVTVFAPPPRRSAVPRAALVGVPVALGVVMLVGFAGWRVLGSGPAPVPASSGETSAVPSASSPPSATPPASVPAPEPPAPAASSAEPPAAPPVSAAPSATAAAKSPPKGRPGARSNCNPPYVIDKRGVRVPKMECM